MTGDSAGAELEVARQDSGNACGAGTLGIGVAVRSQRRAAGWTQADLAQRAGIRRQTIVGIEAGQNMEIQTLLVVLAALGKVLVVADARGDLEQPDNPKIQ